MEDYNINKLVEVLVSVGVTPEDYERRASELAKGQITLRDQILQARRDGLTGPQTAKLLGVPVASVYWHWHCAKAAGEIAPRWSTPEQREQIFKLRDEGLKEDEISGRLGLKVSLVHSVIKRALQQGRIEQRQQRGQRRLDDETKALIRALHHRGVNGYQISKTLHIPDTTVRRYIEQ